MNNNLKLEKKKFVVFMVLILSSLLIVGLLLFDSSKPSYYNSLFLLPLVFSVISFIFISLYNNLLQNIAFSILIFLFYIRMVISPFLMFLGNYTSTISLGVETNTVPAIILICYEFFSIMIAFVIYSKNSNKSEQNKIIKSSYLNGNNKIYFIIIMIIIILLVTCYKISPQLSLIYRTILNIGDVNFASQEDTFIIAKYGTTFIKKFSLVFGNYMMRLMIIVLPAFLIILTKSDKKNKFMNSLISLLLCFIPLFFIGGAIARSLIYTICLLLLRNYLYGDFKNKKIIVIGILSFAFVIVWWFFKSETSSFNNVFQYFSNRLSTYFSGVNIVSGSFNLPDDLSLRFQFFMYDFLKSIPFSNTLFKIKNVTIDVFFNNYNNSYGQIPTTIGTSYYYFGYLLSPIYSIAFSINAFRLSEEIRFKKIINPIQYIRIIYTIIILCMGIVMYNIPITMSNLFTIIIPMFIFEKIAYGGVKNDS